MVKHNLQISLRLFSKTLNTFSFSKHLLHSNAHVIHTGKHKWQQSNTNREHVIDWTQPLKIDVTCFKWCDTTNINQFSRYLRGTILLVMSTKSLAWPSLKTRRSTLITCLLLWFLSLLVLYTVVQSIVGYILYNEQNIWPWILCFPFVNSTDCSIDFDWLRVHVNKEQKLQYHRDKFVRCRVLYCKNRGTSWRKNKKRMQRAKQISNFELLW